MPGQRVLITGSSGLIGHVLQASLGEEYELTGVDRRRQPGVKRVNMARPHSARRAVEGHDVVVDLAGKGDPGTPWSAVHRNNVRAAHNVLDAARRAGVRRVIYASSSRVTGMYERDHPYSAVVAGDYAGLNPADLRLLDSSVPIRPDSEYAVGKAFAEAAARYYADEFGLSVICLRFGHVNAKDYPRNPRQFSLLLTKRDLVHLVRQCIEAPPDLTYAVLYGVSDNTWRFYDIEEARNKVGYEPVDDSEVWRGAASEKRADNGHPRSS